MHSTEINQSIEMRYIIIFPGTILKYQHHSHVLGQVTHTQSQVNHSVSLPGAIVWANQLIQNSRHTLHARSFSCWFSNQCRRLIFSPLFAKLTFSQRISQKTCNPQTPLSFDHLPSTIMLLCRGSEIWAAGQLINTEFCIHFFHMHS